MPARCYWENKDIILFILETIDRQQLSHVTSWQQSGQFDIFDKDFFETETGRTWLQRFLPAS